MHDLSIDIEDGEFLVLVGPSGCGKSTALRMVAGLEDISSGNMLIGDRVVNDVHPKDRDIAMVFQNYALYPHMSVADNIGFALKLAKVPKVEIEERVRKAAQTLDLTEQLDRKPGQLSGGQRQRVAMGRAIVRQPKAFLMDEPLSNLDAKLRVQMRAEIAGLQRDLGVTTIYVTHDQVEAMTMGDRVAVLKRGYLQQVDTPQGLYDSPDNVFVAGFIGSPSMNLMKARLDRNGDGLFVRLGEQSLAVGSMVHERPALESFVGRDVVVGVRPEDIEDAALSPSTPDDRRLRSTVSLTESLGAEIIVHYPMPIEPFAIMDEEFEGEDAVAAATDDTGNYIYVARVNPRSRARIGDAIELAVDTSRMHFFDPESGLAIRD
ncbi:MAG: sn-glycerol-3-phosphate ABC transporter ATP-binding protein UgpC [Acidimicrobiia bacterium]|nr:sn-glycerol-3-phosphate ABC transporter ATP-binding protein UgpC [Acidimicrobiia bacterium]